MTMIELPVDAKRRLVAGALQVLDQLDAKNRDLDSWERHFLVQAIGNMEADAFATAIRQLLNYAKQPSERDAAAVQAIANQPKVDTKGELRQRLEMVKARLASE
ncbi:MAG: hypothetical protein AB7F22_29665 [Reyranella sp.]|uniref:hypothetical protein n=1 Tax=Reyranella sp. TaxID=1929291 RepID=UPI003D1006FE